MMEKQEKQAIIEAILFAAGRQVEIKELMAALEIDEEETLSILEDLKEEYNKLDNKYKESSTCDYNEEKCMKELKLKIVRELDNKYATIRTYGYKYQSRIEVDANKDVVCITDMKTKHNLFYQINYNEFAFDEISIDDYNSYATKNK